MKTLFILVLSAAVLLIASDARSIQYTSQDEDELVDTMLEEKRELEALTDLDADLNEEESEDLAQITNEIENETYCKKAAKKLRKAAKKARKARKKAAKKAAKALLSGSKP
ncbi:GATA type zinc finger protein asd-4-like [Acipenser oxyrinchus oxyrinchus]|uniref:GATA type zinc finger protein asd-4-like n=1 Tax=Acipenser oxyrinchus oxyrinchus TaxID=40147 RepID=A0AAD8CFQ8_ACIOX|nr:GATA type zinc finger protein asd-4-like [Acipenser oxyrinchus oxyrinchus]